MSRTEQSITFKGISLSIQFYGNSIIDLKRINVNLKELEFNQKRKYGIKELELKNKYIQFNYIELTSKNLIVFEDNEITLKTITIPKISTVLIFKDDSIFIGASSVNKLVINKLKNFLNIEFTPIYLDTNQMMKLYGDFFKVHQLILVEDNDELPINDIRLKGNLSELESWKIFSSNRLLSEISGKFEIKDIIYGFKINTNSRCLIFKSGDLRFPLDSLFWLRNYIKNI